MANEFLNTPLLPGKPVPKHRHGHLIVILVLALIVAALMLVGWLKFGDQYQSPAMQNVATQNTQTQSGDEKIVLTAEQSAQKMAEIESIDDSRVKLSPAEAKLKMEQINALK